MLLRFNEGAIVRLKLVGFQEPFSVEGRVVVVTSDEVVIIIEDFILSVGSIFLLRNYYLKRKIFHLTVCLKTSVCSILTPAFVLA